MAEPDDHDNVVYVGRVFRVVYAIETSGKMPAKKFYEGKALTARQQEKFESRFQQRGDEEELVNKVVFAWERGDIYALKIFKRRIYCFRDGDDWVLTNGCKKDQDKADPKELDRADRIMTEHLANKSGRQRGNR